MAWGCTLGDLDGWSTPDEDLYEDAPTPDIPIKDAAPDTLDGAPDVLDARIDARPDAPLDAALELPPLDEGLDVDAAPDAEHDADVLIVDEGVDEGPDACLPPERSVFTLRARPDGEAEAWFLEIRLNPPRVALERDGDDWIKTLTLPPGDHPYRLCRQIEPDDGASCVGDLNNPYVQGLDERDWEGVFPRLRMPDLQAPTIQLASLTAEAGALVAELACERGLNGAVITEKFVSLDGQPIEDWEAGCGSGVVRAAGLSAGRHVLNATLRDASGRVADLYAPFWVDVTPGAEAGEIIYYAVTDRARPGEMEVPPGGWHGGGFDDLTAQLEDLKTLGVSTLCLSSVVASTEAEEQVFEENTETAYHGFWPVATGWPTFLSGISDVVAPRFGGAEALRRLTDAAHALGIRVIADLVIDQVHLHSPLVINQDYLFLPQADWPIEYLPRFDFERAQALDLVADHATALLKAGGLDGFRFSVTTGLGARVLGGVEARIREGVSGPYLLLGGDISEGLQDDEASAALIAAGILDLKLDGRAYGPLINAFIMARAPLSELESWRPDPTRVVFISNHDFTRPLSLAAGQTTLRYGLDADAEGWTTTPEPATEAAYARLRLALTALYTRPGPVMLYYGDEVGLEGIGRPANRRPVPEILNAQQRLTLQRARDLARLRVNHPTIWSGAYQWLDVGSPEWAAWRLDDAYWVVLRREGPDSLSIPSLDDSSERAVVDLIEAAPFTVEEGGVVRLPPWSAVILTEAR